MDVRLPALPSARAVTSAIGMTQLFAAHGPSKCIASLLALTDVPLQHGKAVGVGAIASDFVGRTADGRYRRNSGSQLSAAHASNCLQAEIVSASNTRTVTKP